MLIYTDVFSCHQSLLNAHYGFTCDGSQCENVLSPSTKKLLTTLYECVAKKNQKAAAAQELTVAFHVSRKLLTAAARN